MASFFQSTARLAAYVVLVVAFAGCRAKPATLIAVKGTVDLDGVPVPKGWVKFCPDSGRGNKTMKFPMGEIERDGSYELLSDSETGVPPGWYKVVVIATDDENTPDSKEKLEDMRRNRHWLVPFPYSRSSLTNLAVEVVENAPAGRYDLHLTANPAPPAGAPSSK